MGMLKYEQINQMFSEAINIIKGSIFPIFIQVKQGNLTKFGVSGTGFFIDNDGHFLTACHVITDAPQNSKILYGGNVPYKPVSKLIEIREIYKDTTRDMFLGKVDTQSLPGIEFVDKTPPIGSSICLSGYPLARLAYTPKTGIIVKNVRQYWQPTFLLDYFEGMINNRNYKGFIAQDTSLPGMSGGPVFDRHGKVCGIDVATWTRKVAKPGVAKILINNGLAIKVEEIKDFLTKTKIK